VSSCSSRCSAGRSALRRHERTASRVVRRDNIESSIRRDGDEYVINGRKWYTTGTPDPRCRIIIFMGKTIRPTPTSTASNR